jgi:hypothetical protein
VGIDVGFVTLEFAHLMAGPHAFRKTEANLIWTTRGTPIASALLNAHAFASRAASVPYAFAGAVIGLALPALAYQLTRISATIWQGAKR